MFRKLILLLPLLLLASAATLSAQQSSKSKSKDRFREKDDRRYPVRIINADEINQEGSDYAPAYYKEGIMFVSSREKNGPRDPKTNQTYSELYYAFFDYNGDPSFPQKFEFNEMKKSSYHEGPVCFSRDNKVAFITRNNNKDGVVKANKSGKSTLKIYETRYGRPDWTRPAELPFNSDDYSCMHPSLSADGSKLFFASDMPGGYGGYDIYYVERSSSGWGAPVNLGPVINTDKQEIFPYISQSGSLFFTSNGRPLTLGGLDIYYVNNPLNNPEEVVNLGDQINSDADDMAFIIDDAGKNGFFTSNRARGSGKDDIYRFEAPRGLDGISKPEVNPAQIIVTNAKTGAPLQRAAIRILQPSEDGFVSGNKDFYTIDLFPVQDKPNALSLQLTRRGADDLGAADLYSNVEGKARTEFTRYHNYLVVVSLDGFSPKERLITVDSEDGLTLRFALSEAPVCNRAGGIVATTEFGTRIVNATVKFVHRMSGHVETVRTNWNGEFDACLPEEGEYIAYVERQGFREDNFRVNVKKGDRTYNEIRLQSLTPGASIEATMPLANGIQEGSVIILDKIFYEYNKATLNQSAVRYLDALLELLKRYPEMEIDLIAHTDTRGDTQLNQELTDARAKNAKTYLVFRGVSPEGRINAYGKGESEPRNRCTEGVECSDEEHQQNNRLEVRIRKVGRVPRP
ncbi:MAG: OmpA family protein [Saprospiraceae bacterium]|nr:OmpA family protein [Saprospiraceae bacterium]